MSEFIEIRRATRNSFDMSSLSEEEIVDWRSKTKVGNHAKYDANRKFRSTWSDQYPWVKCKDGRAYCVICKKSIFNNIAHIRKHGDNVSHSKRVKEMNSITVVEADEDFVETKFIKLECEEASRGSKSQQQEESPKIKSIELTASEVIGETPEKIIPISRLEKSFHECEKIVEIWAMKLSKMDVTQQMLAERFVNEVLFEGQMGTLHRNSLQLNIIETIFQSHNVHENSNNTNTNA